MLETHAPLRSCERTQPMAVDEDLGAGAKRDQPGEREKCDQHQDQGRHA